MRNKRRVLENFIRKIVLREMNKDYKVVKKKNPKKYEDDPASNTVEITLNKQLDIGNNYTDSHFISALKKRVSRFRFYG